MAMDNTEFVDRDLVVQERNNVGSNRIRLRERSFSGVTKAFEEFRKKMLESQLNGMQSQLAGSVAFADSNGDILKSEKNLILEKTTAIAKLEEQIKILNREDVPQNFVGKRAIKLADTWLDNCRYNGSSAYSVGIENKDLLFAAANTEDTVEAVSEEAEKEVPVVGDVTTEEVVEEVPSVDVSSEVTEPESVDTEVTEGDLTPVDGSTDEKKEGQIFSDEEMASMSDEEVREAVDKLLSISALNASQKSVADTSELDFDETTEMHDDSAEEMSNDQDSALTAVDYAALDDVVEQSENGETPLSMDEVRALIDSELSKTDLQPIVSKNSETAARVDKYSDGSRLDQFTQPQISFDDVLSKPKDIVIPDFTNFEMHRTGEKADEDRMPVIVPVRENEALAAESDYGVVVDVTTPDSETELSEDAGNIKSDALVSLKQKLLLLQQRSRESSERRIDAERRAQEADMRAADVKSQVEDIRRQYNASVEEANRRISMLEALANTNDKQAEIADLSAEASQRFIDQKLESINAMTDEIEGIKSLLSTMDDTELSDGNGAKSV